MSNYRGQDGLLILGGELIGTPKARAAVATGITEFAVTGGGTMTGLVTVGDIFAIDGGTDHTVTGSFYVVSTNAIATLVFTPAVATAIASNATLTFESHSVAELKEWTLDSEIDVIPDTVKGDKHKTFKGGIAGHRGRATAWLDGADTEQAALLAKIAAGTPDGTVAALTFKVADGKYFYGAALLSNFSVGSPEGSALVPVSFDFQITGPLAKEWN
ncbi:MAG TPA: hypothetical protein VI729_05070 [Anaerolineales bacterium]|nr:hypothetical protein [Anaerolineales bacterium]